MGWREGLWGKRQLVCVCASNGRGVCEELLDTLVLFFLFTRGRGDAWVEGDWVRFLRVGRNESVCG